MSRYSLLLLSLIVTLALSENPPPTGETKTDEKTSQSPKPSNDQPKVTTGKELNAEPKVDVIEEKADDGTDVKKVEITSKNLGTHTITVGENSIKIQSKTVFKK
ncbi:unnamed protein product, partial [Mesorhabditis belari]|uniref:Uncharacterized protein n=1 Tax=Mesorhabditis belari TaxID=2138241 RepID=A0AAF3EJG2_9BILA